MFVHFYYLSKLVGLVTGPGHLGLVTRPGHQALPKCPNNQSAPVYSLSGMAQDIDIYMYSMLHWN